MTPTQSQTTEYQFTQEDYRILSVCASCRRPIKPGDNRHILHDPQRLVMWGWHTYCRIPPKALKYIKIYGTDELKHRFIPKRVKANEHTPQEAVRDSETESPETDGQR